MRRVAWMVLMLRRRRWRRRLLLRLLVVVVAVARGQRLAVRAVEGSPATHGSVGRHEGLGPRCNWSKNAFLIES